jgi:predicted dehydrogenase
MNKPTIRFAAIGLNHGHIYGQCNTLLRAGGELVAFYAAEPELIAPFANRYPQARLARSVAEILQDDSIQMIVSAAVPCERAALGIAAMRHGKDFMADKPGMTTLEQLAEARRAQAQTGRIYSIFYGERLQHKATVRAGELAGAGAIGRPLQTIGLGPHSVGMTKRPDWFWQPEKYGGILVDIASHQFDQFLHFTGSTDARVTAAHVANHHHRQHPAFQDFGEALVAGERGSGYVRVDWLTPRGLGVWGDVRLIVIGTEGFIEIRKNCDLAGRDGGDHLFLVDQQQTRYVDCRDVDPPYGRQLVHDVLNRTETAMTQAHCFLAMELALRAQSAAQWLSGEKGK